MRNKCVQMSPEDICSDVSKSMEENKPALIELLKDHIDFESLIPADFYNAFYLRSKWFPELFLPMVFGSFTSTSYIIITGSTISCSKLV